MKSVGNDFSQNKKRIVSEEGWLAFKDIVDKFHEGKKDADYENIVQRILTKFHIMGCNLSIKLHLIYSQFYYFLQNLDKLREEQGTRFHQELKNMKRRYHISRKMSINTKINGIRT